MTKDGGQRTEDRGRGTEDGGQTTWNCGVLKYLYFCSGFLNPKFLIMIDSETLTLIIMWAIGVVAFFVLWAILAKVVQRISRKKEAEKSAEAQTNEATEKPINANSGGI